MPKADSVLSTTPTNTPTSRRGFLGGTVAALAAGTAVKVAALATMRPAAASPPDDSVLLKLDEQYFEQHELAHAYDDDEMDRLAWNWTHKYRELHEASVLGNNTLSPQERSDFVAAIPECIEHTRLGKLQDPHYARMDALAREMWAIPALTAEGRRAKVLVALDLLPSEWRVVAKDCDYGIREIRQLLIELVGGEPGDRLREQFA